ncbi:adenine-specific methyltransferase EcoRI family protein [Frigoribacterium sp. PvP032]|uniref:adenine-specific methyltransferase EcoRI family protein n=1 Tax=Frigoribacterium sp. PvP032 TaxID=2806589 RepID=UPI001AE2E82A|nr:adenine-specific methyltransferase EcoRI family protein [Frigoribacterium sp. PvP032]MBP1191099.1 hypothetical protein [Frigoribacterium sp. PvP032]
MATGNRTLTRAKSVKYDEFYTRLSEVELELAHYTRDENLGGTPAGNQFAGKVVYCNCDDPDSSNFFRYFAMNFEYLGLAGLIATHFYADEATYKIELTSNADAEYAISAYESALPLTENRLVTPLEGNGDFRNPESILLLKRADIVVTNPPFSLFREYLAQLFEYDKKFLIIGNTNAITYKETFALIKAGKLWTGKRSSSKEMLFDVTAEYADWLVANKKHGDAYKIVDGTVCFRLKSGCWFTNLVVDKRADMPIPFQTREEGLAKGLYPTYNNYDAIEVSRVVEIPADYDGVMGVPITFLEKWIPDSPYEIVQFRHGSDGRDLKFTREGIVRTPYFRVLIRNRHPGGMIK